jgi:hypothetical protein
MPNTDDAPSARPLLMGDKHRPTPGFNVDRIDVAAGIRELHECGWHNGHTHMVIEHALMRWARGEEEAAERGAIDPKFHGIDLTSWRRVLAAARAAGEGAAS